jgi:hypothetical protein
MREGVLLRRGRGGECERLTVGPSVEGLLKGLGVLVTNSQLEK